MAVDSAAGEFTDERLRAIAAVTDSAIGHLDVDDLLEELLARVVDILDADTAAVLLLDESSRQLVARATRGIEEEVRQGVRVAVGVGFAGRVAAERRPIILEEVDARTVWNPILWRKGIRKMLGVPLQNGPALIGVLHIGRLAEKSFTEEDATLLELVASRIAAAVQARNLEVERAAGRVVQRSLLPAALPTCPGIEFATRFVPAEVGGVGGDWYDAFVLPSGDLWVMVGDIAGHGLDAAITMGRLRAALRAYALDSNGPDEVLALADHKLQFFDPGQTATVLCAVLSPPYDTILIASAGHLPPVLASPDGEAAFVDVSICPPFGVTTCRPPVTSVGFEPGSVLVAYTDGLIERRGESLDVGMARLAAAVTPGNPELVCRRIMEELIGGQEPGDDIAVIAMRRSPDDSVEVGRPGRI